MSLFDAFITTILMSSIHFVWLVLISFKGDWARAGVVLGYKSPVKMERIVAWVSAGAGTITNITVMCFSPMWGFISFGLGFVAGPRLLRWCANQKGIDLS